MRPANDRPRPARPYRRPRLRSRAARQRPARATSSWAARSPAPCLSAFGLEIGDSMLFARPDNRNDVMCAGSHGGRVNMARALEIRPRGALLSDGSTRRRGGGHPSATCWPGRRCAAHRLHGCHRHVRRVEPVAEERAAGPDLQRARHVHSPPCEPAHITSLRLSAARTASSRRFSSPKPRDIGAGERAAHDDVAPRRLPSQRVIESRTTIRPRGSWSIVRRAHPSRERPLSLSGRGAAQWLSVSSDSGRSPTGGAPGMRFGAER